MTEIRINNPVRDNFAMVPNSLYSWPGLSVKAKFLMAYLLQFRSGVCPPVAAIEAQSGLSRDARRAAMGELMAAGLAQWVVQRDKSGRVVAKFLEVTTLPLLQAVVAQAAHAPENQAHGREGGETPVLSHAPENPSDGFSVPPETETRPSGTGNQAILKREDKKRRAAAARASAPVGRKRAVGAVQPVPADWSDYQRKAVRLGQSVQIGGEWVLPKTDAMQRAQVALEAWERA